MLGKNNNMTTMTITYMSTVGTQTDELSNDAYTIYSTYEAYMSNMTKWLDKMRHAIITTREIEDRTDVLQTNIASKGTELLQLEEQLADKCQKAETLRCKLECVEAAQRKMKSHIVAAGQVYKDLKKQQTRREDAEKKLARTSEQCTLLEREISAAEENTKSAEKDLAGRKEKTMRLEQEIMFEEEKTKNAERELARAKKITKRMSASTELQVQQEQQQMYALAEAEKVEQKLQEAQLRKERACARLSECMRNIDDVELSTERAKQDLSALEQRERLIHRVHMEFFTDCKKRRDATIRQMYQQWESELDTYWRVLAHMDAQGNMVTSQIIRDIILRSIHPC